MFVSTPDRHLASAYDRSERPLFVLSHRAFATCGQELERLVETVTQECAALCAAEGAKAPVVRRSPDRCIVQLGPVALSLAWLRGSGSTVAEGELLAIVWRGAVAPRSSHSPERGRIARAAVAPTALWEEGFTVTAENEESWRWQTPAADVGAITTTALAERCLGALRRALAEGAPNE